MTNAKGLEGADESALASAALGETNPPSDLPEPDLTENALKVLERRYLVRGADGNLSETPRQLFWRVASTVAKAELNFQAAPEEALEVARDYYTLMSQRMFLPNSPCPVSYTHLTLPTKA